MAGYLNPINAGGANLPPNFFFENSYWQNCLTELFLFLWTFNMVVDVMISKKILPDKIFPRSYMDFEQKYQNDPSMNRVKLKLLLHRIWRNQSLFVLYDNFWLPCKTWKAAAKEAKIQRRVLPLLTAPPSLVKNVWLFTMKLESATLTVLSKTIIIVVSRIVGKMCHLDFSFLY